MVAVFSDGSSMVAPPVFGEFPHFDVPQDFSVPGNGVGAGVVQVVIPIGATHILFSTDAGYGYMDPDGDYSVLIRPAGDPSLYVGDDVLNGSVGNDVLEGGTGRDSFMGGPGNDTMDGAEITDRISYTDLNSASYLSSAAGINVNVATGVVQDGLGGTDQLANINFITGSNFNDTLVGSSTSDLFEQFDGAAGNDTIDGGVIDPLTQANGNRASYEFVGAAVNVNLAAGTATGGGGTDTLVNINHVRGSAFADVIVGSNSTLTEQLEGMAGHDTIDGAGGIDIVRYDNGIPVAPSLVGVNASLATGIVADGQGGIDRLVNIEGLSGSAFSDVLTGGNAANGTGTLDGFEFFIGNGGDDSIDGGGGYDRVDYTSSVAAVTVTLGGTGAGTAQDALGGTDTLANIEAVRGSLFDDTLTGSDTAAFESFEGRHGSDLIDGRGGVDRADYADETARVSVSLAAGQAADGSGGFDTLLNIENVRGSVFADGIAGSALDNWLEGNGGSDTLLGADGNDTMDGGAGFDIAVFVGGRAAYSVDFGASGVTVSNGTFTDVVADVEQLLFDDGGAFVLNNRPFDALRYLASYPDLIASFGTNVDAAAQHWATSGYAEGRQVTFSPMRYVASHADLMQAFGTDSTGATLHYINIGFAEGRQVTFDPVEYLAANTDVLAALGPDVEAAAAHYVADGFAAGRTLDFDGLRYLASHPDLIAAFGSNTAAATSHYVFGGFAEGRHLTFDALNYIASYGDLMGAFGTNTQAATAHWVASGFTEGREVTFSPIQYALGNTDLIGAFGFDQAALATHWIASGAAEGRSASLAANTGTPAGDALVGGGAAEAVRGLEGNDTLNGGANHDLLIGGLGNDVMTGGAGNLDLDVFQWASLADTGDAITDFAVGTDKLAFLSSGFGFLAPGQLDAGRFAASSAALGAAPGFVYDQASGVLSYDADGVGAVAAVPVMGIAAGQALTANDVLILG